MTVAFPASVFSTRLPGFKQPAKADNAKPLFGHMIEGGWVPSYRPVQQLQEPIRTLSPVLEYDPTFPNYPITNSLYSESPDGLRTVQHTLRSIPQPFLEALAKKGWMVRATLAGESRVDAANKRVQSLLANHYDYYGNGIHLGCDHMYLLRQLYWHLAQAFDGAMGQSSHTVARLSDSPAFRAVVDKVYQAQPISERAPKIDYANTLACEVKEWLTATGGWEKDTLSQIKLYNSHASHGRVKDPHGEIRAYIRDQILAKLP